MRVVGARESRRAEPHYRGKDYADQRAVVSALAPSAACRAPLGDLVICAPVVRARGARAGQERCARTARTWWCTARCTCVGYDHERRRDARRMERARDRGAAPLGFAESLPVASEAHGEGSRTRTGRWLEAHHRRLAAASRRTASELVELLREARRARPARRRRAAMIEGVLEVAEMQVRDIMVPRAQMVFVRRDDPLDDASCRSSSSPATRASR